MQIPRGEYLLVFIFTEVSYFKTPNFHIHVMCIELHHTTKCPTCCRTNHCYRALTKNNLVISDETFGGGRHRSIKA